MKIVSNARFVARKIKYFLSRTPQSAMKVLEASALRMRDRLNVRKPVSYPIQWDSENQRKKFFATNGFGHGIPYQRTGKTVWNVSTSFGQVNLFAPHPAGPVFGRMPNGAWWQSRIHRSTWPNLRKVLFEELSRIPAEIINELKMLVNGQKP